MLSMLCKKKEKAMLCNLSILTLPPQLQLLVQFKNTKYVTDNESSTKSQPQTFFQISCSDWFDWLRTIHLLKISTHDSVGNGFMW